MSIQNRLKIVVKHLIGRGIAENQEKLGELLGYSNKASFSHILNNRKPLPADFIDRIINLDRNINKVWIEKGEGSMLIDNITNNVSDSQAEYNKSVMGDENKMWNTIDRNSRNIEKMVEIADRNSISIKELVESNKMLIGLLYQNGYTIPNEYQNTKKGDSESEERHKDDGSYRSAAG